MKVLFCTTACLLLLSSHPFPACYASDSSSSSSSTKLLRTGKAQTENDHAAAVLSNQEVLKGAELEVDELKEEEFVDDLYFLKEDEEIELMMLEEEDEENAEALEVREDRALHPRRNGYFNTRNRRRRPRPSYSNMAYQNNYRPPIAPIRNTDIYKAYMGWTSPASAYAYTATNNRVPPAANVVYYPGASTVVVNYPQSNYPLSNANRATAKPNTRRPSRAPTPTVSNQGTIQRNLF